MLIHRSGPTGLRSVGFFYCAHACDEGSGKKNNDTTKNGKKANNIFYLYTRGGAIFTTSMSDSTKINDRAPGAPLPPRYPMRWPRDNMGWHIIVGEHNITPNEAFAVKRLPAVKRP